MFEKKHRLPIKQRNWNRQIFTNPFLIIKLKQNGLLCSRFGVIVSKKIDKRAVVRNRIKRTVSSCLRALSKHLKGKYDILLIVKKPILLENVDSISSSLKQELKKENLIE